MKNLSQNLFLKLVALVLTACVFGFACQKEASVESDSGSILNFGDQTSEAVELVDEANADLREVRRIYKENTDGVAVLREAVGSKDTATVKKTCDELKTAIDDGINYGEKALEKISKASEMQTNQTFKEYLRLKELSLQKQLDAFKSRREAAKLLRDQFGTNDTREIERAKLEFAVKEDNFQKLLESAEELNKRADELVKKSQE